jgi:glycerol-3-phosphate dehydrogenase
MAEETIDRGIKAGLLEKRKCVTKTFSFYSNVTKLRSERLRIYSNGAPEIERMIDEKPELARLIDPRLPYTKAEIIWICRNEMPRTIGDMLARRTRALFLDARASAAIAPDIAGIMAEELKTDKNWRENQIEEYNRLILNYI